jgi:poly(3-hydroxybutyrate) depolymerase
VLLLAAGCAGPEHTELTFDAATSPDAAASPAADGGVTVDAARAGADAGAAFDAGRDTGRDAASPSDARATEPTPADAAITPDGGPSSAGSSAALAQLEAYLAMPRGARPELEGQAFASVALTRADAERARELLWQDFRAYARETRQSEVGASETVARTISGPKLSLRYYLARRGEAPASGRSLFISMHGGGNAAAATNDSQWRNQISLVTGYNPKDAVWVAPRAPIDDWNMWFVEGIDALIERLISDMIVFEGVDPNKVYLNGYSAGGDGVYQLGPRMAERWAGAGMSAGHPNAASPLSLRNLAFAIHVGGDDTSFDRNKKAEEWGMRLDQLAKSDPGGYEHQWQVHAGLPHWMNLADNVSIPFLQAHVRDPIPKKVVWEQSDLPRATFYWLACAPDQRVAKSEIRASYAPGKVSIESAKGVRSVLLRLSDAMMDLDLPVLVEQAGTSLHSGAVLRTIAVLARTLAEREDPALMFSSELSISLR